MPRAERLQEARDLSDATFGLLAEPKEAWVPVWPRSFTRVPGRKTLLRFFLYFSFKRQFCGDRNLFAATVRHLAVPRGMRRAAYVESIKNLICGEIAYRASIDAAVAYARNVTGTILPFVAFGTAFALRGLTWSTVAAGALGLLLGCFVAFLLAEITQLGRGRAAAWAHRLASVLGLAIGAATAVAIAADPSSTTFRAAELVAGVVVGYAVSVSVVASLIIFICRRGHLRQHLDQFVAFQLVWMFHQGDGHPNEWGTPPVTSDVAAVLEDTASVVQRYLPRYLGGSSTWREPEKVGYAIAENLREHKLGLTQRAGRTPYVRWIGQAVQHVVASGWGDLAGERELVDPPAPTWQRRLRSMIAATSVLLLGIGLQASGLSIGGLPTSYVLTLGLLWLLAYLIPWLDPDFAERLRVVTDLRALTRPGAGGGKAEAPGRDRKHAA